jgi:ATP-binding protein involved in chromosome partitioning
MSDLPEKKFLPGVKRVIGVVSGKGGVGKSTVSVLLALALAARGRKVGMLDADITGPSLPRLLGVDSFPGGSDGKKLLPVESEEGIKVLSINLYHENEEDPVVWRGPLLAGAITQFYGDTEWGDLDYLVVDFPPGTSDVAITAFQTIPFSGVVVVGTPQDYVSMIVAKSVKMAAMLEAPVLGMVENMRSLICPDCGKTIKLFDDGKDDSAKRLGLPLISSLPWRKEVAQARSLRWKDLPAAVKKDADAIASEVELAVASRPAPNPAPNSAPKSESCGAGGCECGTSTCCEGCSSALAESEG